MAKANKRNKWTKVLIFIAVFIAIVLIANILVKFFIEKKIRSSFNQFAPYIKTDFTSIHIHLLAASISIDSVAISYQPNLKKQNKHEIYFNSASLSGINFFKLVGSKSFYASAFKINNGRINLSKYLLNSKDSLPASLFPSAHIPFKKISFGLIEIKNVDVFDSDSKTQKSLLNGNISLNDVTLNKIDSSFSKSNIHFSNATTELNNIKYDLPGYHLLSVKKALLNSKDSSLKIDSLKIIPQLGKIEIGKKIGHQVDRIDAKIENIKVVGLDVKQLMNKKFFAQQLDINNTKVYAFRDRRLPREMKHQPTPLDYLKNIPAEVRIKNLNLNNASATSEEFPKEGSQTGYIKIEHIYIHLSPVLNQPKNSDQKFITANVNGSIMNAGIIKATINLSLITGVQNIKGYIENLNLPAMNPSAENLGKFKVESGVLNRLDFDFIATNEKATGKIIGVYHDLVVDKLKLKDGKLKEAKLPSFALHHIIIPKNKDASLDVKHRTGKIDYDRDPTRLVTFYLLKSLLDGIRDSFSLGFVLPK
ncbi:MAG TPA: hypothetical protein VEV62_02620 [Parafilimonas sp.]|nr:hypothetical protein [Parafilimonas sp.]